MAERTPPLHQQNATTHTAAGDRALIHSIFSGREGVSDSADLAVAQNGTPNMSVNIASGRAVVFGDDSADQQLYHIWNDATVNKTISAADPTNPRRDLVIAEVRDTLFGGAANDWRLRVITGTPAASPADPSTPNTAIVLARVAVAAGATSITNANITDLRRRAGTVGVSDVICTSTTRPASPFVGMKIYETDTAKALVYAGTTSGWQPPWNMPWGVMGQAVVSAEQTVANGGVDLTGASVTYTAVAGRRVRISAKALMSNGTLAAGWSLRVYKDGSIYDTVGFNNDTVAAASYGCAGETIDAPTAGSHTYKLNAFFSVNTDNKVAYSGLNFSTIIIVEDIGPSANPT